MNMNHVTKRMAKNEEGFASIAIALVLIIVLALLALGFAQLSRREQQSALNKQLATQANYAAESGINEVARLIEQNPSAIPSNSSTTCISPAIIGGVIGNSSKDVQYTCALAELNPKSLERDLAADKAWYTTFSTTPGLSNLHISWQHNGQDAKTPKSAMPVGAEFSPTADWNAPAVLQVNITPVGGGRADWVKNSFTVYLYPAAQGVGTNSVNYASNTQEGKVISGKCTAGVCSASINGLPSGSGLFLLHVVDYYDASKITVKATTGANQEVAFNNAQAMVDVTGKARNVLKRLRVRIPLTPTSPLPNYALEATNICKRQSTEPSRTDYLDANGDIASSTSSPECFLGATPTDAN